MVMTARTTKTIRKKDRRMRSKPLVETLKTVPMSWTLHRETSQVTSLSFLKEDRIVRKSVEMLDRKLTPTQTWSQSHHTRPWPLCYLLSGCSFLQASPFIQNWWFNLSSKTHWRLFMPLTVLLCSFSRVSSWWKSNYKVDRSNLPAKLRWSFSGQRLTSNNTR